MEIIERLPLRPVAYIKSFSYEQFKQHCSPNGKNEEERKKQYYVLQNFCDTMLKTKGCIKRIYAYSAGQDLKSGRLFCGSSLQTVPKKIRGLLCSGTMTDLDMSNCHPVILQMICRLNNIPCPNLSWYNANREQVLIEHGPNAKKDFLKSVNTDQPVKTAKGKFFKEFDKECKEIQKLVCACPEYSELVSSVPASKTYNINGSAINRILCHYENLIIQDVYSYLSKRDIETSALMFDGLMIYGDHYDNLQLLDDIQQHINSKWPHLDSKWTYKEHDTSITIPADFSIEEKPKQQLLENSFDDVREEFEKTNFFVKSKACFFEITENMPIVRTQQQLMVVYRNLYYNAYDKDGKVVKKHFINDWLDYEERRTYRDVDCYPNPELCPDDVFNSWLPFAMERVENFTWSQEGLDVFLEHFKMICDYDEEAFNYVIAWLAQMIQFPEIKSTCLIFMGQQGYGKSTIAKIIKALIGSAKMFVCATPDTHVWGTFNGKMLDAFVVNLEELSRKATMDSSGAFKDLVTGSDIVIHYKGKEPFTVNSYHRFFVTTNESNPIKTSNDDRRNVFIKCNTVKPTDEYFDKLYEHINNINSVKTFYEYLKNSPSQKDFRKLPLPTTQVSKDLKELSRPHWDTWLEDFSLAHENTDIITLSKEEAFEKFNDWCSDCGVKMEFQYAVAKFLTDIRTVKGVSLHKTKTKNLTKFDFAELRKHYGLDCLLE